MPKNRYVSVYSSWPSLIVPRVQPSSANPFYFPESNSYEKKILPSALIPLLMLEVKTQLSFLVNLLVKSVWSSCYVVVQKTKKEKNVKKITFYTKES